MTEETPKKKTSRPGAPPGNHNALKHGFYSSHFSPDEINWLDNNLEGGLKSEQDLLRVLIRHTVTAMQSENMSYEHHIVALRTICLAMARLQAIYRLSRLEAIAAARRGRMTQPAASLPPAEKL
jgi:hypothetical protein